MQGSEQQITDSQGRLLASYDDNWLSESEQHQLWLILQSINWQQPKISIFGKTHFIPRQQCYLGHLGCAYRYSGLLLQPEPLPALVTRIMARAGQEFNAVLLNRYRNGQERMGWHRDNEPELGPKVAILSLGATRRLRLRWDSNDSVGVDLTAGSLLRLAPWVYHCLSPTKARTDERISLTFRQVTANFHCPC